MLEFKTMFASALTLSCNTFAVLIQVVSTVTFCDIAGIYIFRVTVSFGCRVPRCDRYLDILCGEFLDITGICILCAIYLNCRVLCIFLLYLFSLGK